MSKVASKIQITADETTRDLNRRTQILYFNWLCHLVSLDDWQGQSYYVLAKILHNIEFYSLVEKDENREIDGARLRTIWFEGIKNEAEALGVGYPTYRIEALSGPCTMLEMLVGLSTRLEADVMQDDLKGNRSSFWFWQMMANLTLGELQNLSDDVITPEWESRVKLDVARILDRKYGKSGRFSLFPLRNAPEDMRMVELWYQAQYWLKENF